MSRFIGGSAFAMARDVAEGFVQISDRSFRGMSAAEVQQLAQEFERHMRDLRGEPSAGDESAVLQARQRKLMRLRTALVVLRGAQQRNRPR